MRTLGATRWPHVTSSAQCPLRGGRLKIRLHGQPGPSIPGAWFFFAGRTGAGTASLPVRCSLLRLRNRCATNSLLGKLCTSLCGARLIHAYELPRSIPGCKAHSSRAASAFGNCLSAYELPRFAEICAYELPRGSSYALVSYCFYNKFSIFRQSPCS